MTTMATAAVKVAQGELRGHLRGGIRTFLGIPYAQSPFGELRFAPPVPAGAWPGVLDAFEFGPTAPKPGYSPPFSDLLPEPAVDGLDCLNLNVWAPTDAVDRPVLVWVHGGAFVNGSSAVSLYDGSAFARDGVVFVSLNYRLGVDGFGSIADCVDNRGLLDQLAALTWVRDNIAAFGGNPGNVTVAGESAGAMSVGALLAMPAASGLFRRAILESGAADHVLRASTAAAVTSALAERLRVEPTAAGFGSIDIDLLVEAAQELSAEIGASRDPALWHEITVNAMPFEPVVDGSTLPTGPLEAISAGSGKEVDILIGTNAEENALFLVPTGIFDLIDRPGLREACSALGGDVDKIIDVYESARPGAAPGQLLNDVMTDWFYRIPAIRLAEARQRNGSQTFMYEFAWRSPEFDGRLGACHALEIGFVFDNLADPAGRPLAGPHPPQSLADEMHSAWVRFVSEGAPGWPAYGTERTVRIFDESSSTAKDPRADERGVWAGIR